MKADIQPSGVTGTESAEPRADPSAMVFVETMVERGLAVDAPNGSVSPAIDWKAVWAAADTDSSSSEGQAKVVAAAYAAVQATGASEAALAEMDRVLESERPDLVASAHPVNAGATSEEGSNGSKLAGAWAKRPVSVDRARSAAHHHLPTVFTWIRNIGVIILLFVAWQLWGTAIAEHHAQSSLQSQFESLIHKHPATIVRHGSSLIPVTAHVANPPEGTVVAELNVPAIGLNQFVVSGTATDDLAKGPGHYIGSAAPGQAGNVAIAGHRTTHGAPFNRLAELKVGDRIILTNTTDQHLTYVVSQTPSAVPPSDVSVLDNFGDNRITLTTCNPEFSATQRLIVVAMLLAQNQGSAHQESSPVAYQIVNGATASWRWPLLPLVLLEVGVLVTLGLFNRRLASFYGTVGGWLILTPIWVAAFYLLFGTLTNFLPSSI